MRPHTGGPHEFNNDCDLAGYGIWDCFGGSEVIAHYPSIRYGILISDPRMTIVKWQLIIIREVIELYLRTKSYSQDWLNWVKIY